MERENEGIKIVGPAATKHQEYCTANWSQIVRNEKKKRIKEEEKAKGK